MRMHRHRFNYWSCSKFAQWVYTHFDIQKPFAETSSGWKEWKEKTKASHPHVYNFVEEYLDLLQDIVMYPYDLYDNFRIYIRNRFITKTHIIRTGLTPGQWHETDERLLHGMFELLVDFIEIEKANMLMVSDSTLERPWWRKFRWSRWGEYRSREDGLKYLDWEMNLTDDDQHFTSQAMSAREQYELYTWWKDKRPTRPDPYDVTGWTEWCNQRGDDISWILEDKTNADRQETRTRLDALNLLEEQYDKEDTEMLDRLVKLRHHLWT